MISWGQIKPYRGIYFPPVKVERGESKKTLLVTSLQSIRRFIDRGTSLWNTEWSTGWNLKDPIQKDLIEKVLYINKEQLHDMHYYSKDKIFFGFLFDLPPEKVTLSTLSRISDPMQLSSAIFGVGHNKIPENSDVATYGKSFRGANPKAQRRECVSVFADREYQGFKLGHLSLGQVNVKAQKLDAIRNPFEVDLDAYSRPVALNQFAYLLWELRNRPENKTIIRFKDRKMYDQTGKMLDADKNGIYYVIEGGKDYIIKTSDKIKSSIIIKDNKYFLMPGEVQLDIKSNGIFINNFEELLIESQSYINTQFDHMRRFHGQLGGIPIRLIHNGREIPGTEVGDYASLNHIVVYNFNIFDELTKINDRYQRFMTLLSIKQQWLLRNIACFMLSGMHKKSNSKGGDAIRIIKDEKISEERLIDGAFSKRKLERLAAEIERNDLIEPLSRWEPREPNLTLEDA